MLLNDNIKRNGKPDYVQAMNTGGGRWMAPLVRTSALYWTGWRASCPVPSSLGKKLLVPTEQDIGWAPQQVYIFWIKSLLFLQNPGFIVIAMYHLYLQCSRDDLNVSFQAFKLVKLRFLLFWDITIHSWVFTAQNNKTVYWSENFGHQTHIDWVQYPRRMKTADNLHFSLTTLEHSRNFTEYHTQKV